MPRLVEQNEVQALQEFLQIDCKICAQFNLLQRADRRMNHRDFSLRRVQPALNKCACAVSLASSKVRFGCRSS